MTKGNNYWLIFVICSSVFFAGCDASYKIKGTVYGEIKQELGESPLSDVQIDLFYVNKSGKAVRYSQGQQYKTNNDGDYDIFFLGPSSGLIGNEFLEFKKEGYETKHVSIKDENNRDASIVVQKCPEKGPYNYCWIVDVILSQKGR